MAAYVSLFNGKWFFKFFYIYLLLEKFIKYKKYILVNDKFNLIFRKFFLF
jgi:hypothetical protein